ncbi:MAG: glycerol-3-phosphate acyltransferase, partial [Lachnospiraceae bacterium]|nr:glycerol-3-phosphate acyltransferase [Lachnospiraceae bacterium]
MDVITIVKIAAVAVIAYLLGSINVAIVVTKLFTGKDIRTMGSGNGGFTNVMRSVGTTAGIITFAGDFLKCVAAVLLGGIAFSSISFGNASVTELAGYGKYLAGTCCFLGHIFPVYFKFKGGKGVVTMAALGAVINFPVFLISLLAFAVVFLITKIISISSMLSAVVMTAATFGFTYFYNYKYLGEVSFTYVVI